MSVPQPRPWGAPFDRLDRAWTSLEQYLAVVIIVVEIVTLTSWVALKGMAATYTPGGNIIGVIFRAVVGAIVLGIVAHLITKPKEGAPFRVWHPIVVTISAGVGVALAPLWANVFSDWCTNVVQWLTNASALALIGGPRGLVTRLTLWLALLGASMAASKGKHINIDVATRYIPLRYVKGVAILGWVAASLVCFAASYGFVDSIAVTKFRAEAFRSCDTGLCETPIMERWGVAAEGVRSDLFLLGRQVSLDLDTIPHVLAGDRYDQWLDAAHWNAWLDEGDWVAHFPAEAVASMKLPLDDPNIHKMPAVIAPDTGEGRDLLIRDLNFLLPFGLLMVALKFLLRTVRALSGHVRVDPGAAHDDEDLKVGHDAPAGGAV